MTLAFSGARLGGPRMTRALLWVAGFIGEGFRRWLETRRSLEREHAALLADNERLRDESEWLRRRFERLPPRERPRYRPDERLAILAHRRRWKLSYEETARRFVVAVQTLANWERAVEEGVKRLVTTREPMNKLSDLVREVAHSIRRERPKWGSRRIAGLLAKLGLQASRRSVQRVLRKPRPRPARVARVPVTRRPVVARRPNHVWYVDLTHVKAFMGLFTVTIGAVIDGFSRKVLAIEAWSGVPDARDARRLVGRAIRAAGAPGRYLVSDHGTQFTARLFTGYLRRRKIRHRYGAVAHPQSVGRIERFWRSLKDEWADAFFALRPLSRVRRELALYQRWFNAERVHQALGGRTPEAVFLLRQGSGGHVAGRRPRPQRRLVPGGRYALSVSYLDNSRKLPKFVLRAA